MIHIVFQEADIEVLQKAIELDEQLAGEVLMIKDDFAVGPLESIDTEEGWAARENWWRSLIELSPYPNEIVGSFDDRKTVSDIKQKLTENEAETVWVWMGQNGHDVCGYYWLVTQFQDFAGRIYVLYLNNLPFINEKGQIFYPTTLHQIQPSEFLKAKKLNRAITLSEYEVDGDEWRKLCAENKMVRLLEGGKKIVSKEASFYDGDLLSALNKDWQKGNRYFHTLLSKMKIKTGDVFLLWRLKELANDGAVEINGDTTKSWKDFEVRLKRLPTELFDIEAGQ